MCAGSCREEKGPVNSTMQMNFVCIFQCYIACNIVHDICLHAISHTILHIYIITAGFVEETIYVDVDIVCHNIVYDIGNIVYDTSNIVYDNTTFKKCDIVWLYRFLPIVPHDIIYNVHHMEY